MANYRVSTGLPQLPPPAYDTQDFAKFLPIYQALNALSTNLSSATGLVDYDQAELAERNQLGSLLVNNQQTIYPKAASSLGFGLLVNLFVSGGKILARPADASLGRPAHGIVNEPDGIATNSFGKILFFEGHCLGVSGTSFGTPYYLGNAGLMTTPSPAPGYTQPVAWGLGSLGVYLRIQFPL
jgi:hypothetical protein